MPTPEFVCAFRRVCDQAWPCWHDGLGDVSGRAWKRCTPIRSAWTVPAMSGWWEATALAFRADRPGYVAAAGDFLVGTERRRLRTFVLRGVSGRRSRAKRQRGSERRDPCRGRGRPDFDHHSGAAFRFSRILGVVNAAARPTLGTHFAGRSDFDLRLRPGSDYCRHSRTCQRRFSDFTRRRSGPGQRLRDSSALRVGFADQCGDSGALERHGRSRDSGGEQHHDCCPISASRWIPPSSAFS